MAFHIKNPETDALARRIAALKRTGRTEAVHAALKHELEREQARPSLVEMASGSAVICEPGASLITAGPPTRRFATACTRMTDVHRRLGPDGADDQRG
ncbi:type II toxin-antitoxin system VapB family antitoxin [Mesorhizobium sp. M0800]|uniref:type II toxin-antitoxin system VapB family antitoxin n=1 Tax=Mesorhizobium sp. M0800 TaxID=2957000 RepID=UPI00333DA8B8